MTKMIIVSLLLSATSAFAAKSNTEYYFRPAAGAHAITANYLMDIKPGKLTNGTTEFDFKQEIGDIQLQYLYGLSEGHAIGLSTFTGTNKTTVGTLSTDQSGMGDLYVNYRGFAGMWYYGADLGINLEKIKTNAAGNVTNRASGGMSLRANVGVLMASDMWNYGGDLSYLMPFERQYDGNSGTKVTEGGLLKVSPFVEYNWGMGFLGAELSYLMQADRTEKTGSASTTFKGESYAQILLNGSFDFNETFTGLLSLGMAMHPEHDNSSASTTTKAKAYTETIASLGVRATF